MISLLYFRCSIEFFFIWLSTTLSSIKIKKCKHIFIRNWITDFSPSSIWRSDSRSWARRSRMWMTRMGSWSRSMTTSMKSWGSSQTLSRSRSTRWGCEHFDILLCLIELKLFFLCDLVIYLYFIIHNNLICK